MFAQYNAEKRSSLPVSEKLSNLSFGNVERGPSIIYTIVFDVVFIGMLLIIGSKQIAVYDFSRE